MSEPTLSLQITDFKTQAAIFLGWGTGASPDPPYNATQTAQLTLIMNEGYRRFLYPSPLEGENTAYTWSFLTPIATIALPLNQNVLPLPDDFGGFNGQITMLTTNTNALPWKIEWKNEGLIRQMLSVTPTMTGPPRFASMQPIKGVGAQSSTRWNLLLFPLADQAYTLQLPYYVNPDALDGGFPYAYGGAQHASTILASCLAVAEEILDDTKDVRAVAFQERLRASISMDRKNKPDKIGLNIDRSDDQGWDRSLVHYGAPAATYNGGPFA